MLNRNRELKVEIKIPILHFSELFQLISTVPLNVLSEIINSAYLKLVPLILIFKAFRKTKN